MLMGKNYEMEKHGKYGFVYIWYDRKYKRYYIGSHWGTEDDGYICSSMWMRNSYNRRREDFRRRILKRVDNRQELKEEEQKWVSLISDNKIGKKYYNLTKKVFGYWFEDKEKFLSTRQKISESQKGKIISEETKQKNREATFKQFSNPVNREAVKQQMIAKWQDPEYRRMQQEVHKKPRPNRQGVPTNIAGITGIKFVTYDKKRDKYRVKVRGKYIGQYNSLHEARNVVECFHL